MRFREGMTFTIEPMSNEGTPEMHFLEEGWTVVTADNKLSTQCEHTIAVTSNGCEILAPAHAQDHRPGLSPSLVLKFLTQDSRAPKIVYKGFSVVRKRRFEWDLLCVALGKGRGRSGFWSGCGL
jgi:hypothetical protein